MGGPGTELKALLAELGLSPDGCDCDRRAAAMDALGPSGCREMRANIVAWLKAAWPDLGRGERARFILRALFAGRLLRVDPVGALVDEAVRRAETKIAAASPPASEG